MHRNYEKTKNNLNEKLKGMIDMKKILKNGKKAVTGLVLTMMAVCMISSVAQGANNIKRSGYRDRDTNGYYSYTKVSGYDDNGFGLNLRVGAQIVGGEWSYWDDRGEADMRSKSVSFFADAKHSYRIGGGSKVTWIQNKK